MSYFQDLKNKIYQGVEKRVLLNADFRALKVVAEAKSGQTPPSEQLEYEAKTMQAKNLQDWSNAVTTATDPYEPDKTMLKDLYENLMLDNHLASVIDSRVLFCQRSPFKIVDQKGENNEELVDFFERPWFEDFIKKTLLSRFEGAKLVELWDFNQETKELVGVDEIPMDHFNAIKGIITKAPGETQGWEYKEGAYQPYYIQIGKNKDIGMLAQVAPIVLAKKLGFGSWLDYVEKYGVPSLFITTDREDDKRLKELYNAAINFKSNNFMVGRGQEKFEVANTDGNNANSFDLLIERANSEISKRILGGSGLTDEKAFVGSTEIQFRLAKDRFESDKLLVKNIINQELLPRLQRISPVYSKLANHYFEWDNSETHSSKDVTDIISKIGGYFDFDEEELSQKLGMTVKLKEQAAPTNFNPPGKKKSLN